MDSPLLPTLKRIADMSGSPTGLMSQMSLEPMSPGDSFMFDHPPTTRPNAPLGGSHSALGPSSSLSQHAPSLTSSSASSFQRSASASSSRHQLDEETAWDETPQPRRTAPRFSLFAPGAHSQPAHDSRAASADANDGQLEGEGDGKDMQEGEDGQDDHDDVTRHPRPRVPDAGRDDKLRESLYELRQMNEVFDGFLIALEAARGHNERLASRVKETSALLDMYTAILGQQEHNLSLIRNPNWRGGLDDVRVAQEEEDRRFAEEQAALAAAEAARRAEEQRAADEAQRQREREAARAAAAQAPATRGSTRGRGVTRGLTRGSGIPAPASRTGTARPPSATGIRKPSAGLGGQYSHVKGSGYGPGPRKPAV